MSVPVESPSSTSVGDEVITTAKVVLPAESLSGGTEVRDKVVTAAEAVRLIRDGDSVVVEGFVGQCFAEELTLALGAAVSADRHPPRIEPGLHRRPGRPAGPRA